MFADFLWLMGAKQQHDRQEEQGLAGFMGLILATLLSMFMVWKWDSLFYPIFNKLGFVGFAERVGLIHDLPLMTVINVFSVLFFILLFIGLGLALLVATTLISFAIGQTKLGSKIMLTGATITLSPLLLPAMIYLSIKNPRKNFTMKEIYKKDKNLRPLLTKYDEYKDSFKMFRLYQEQIQRNDLGYVTDLSFIEGKSILNKVINPHLNDKEWLFGYNKYEDKWFILFQNPLPEFTSSSADLTHSRKIKELYNYPSNYAANAFIESGDRPSMGFFTNALPVNFIWSKNQLQIKLEDNNVEIQNTKHMTFHKIECDEVKELFNEIAERNDTKKALHHVHMAFYLIPIAFKGNVPFSADGGYNEEVKFIPNSDTFHSLYRMDIQDSVVKYSRMGCKWATEWLEETSVI